MLKGLNLELKRGTSTAVVGRSGAGKSTIASLLSRFYEPDEGAGRTNVSCASSATGRCSSNALCRQQPCIASRPSRQADRGGASENSAACLNVAERIHDSMADARVPQRLHAMVCQRQEWQFPEGVCQPCVEIRAS